MPSSIFFILLGILVLGVLFVLAGRRGRRLNDHPQCRWCGFDLHGVYPQNVTCPECGAGLKRDKAVRMGVRKRLPVLIALGGLMIVLPLIPAGLLVYAAMTGTNLSKHMPLGVLLWQAKNTNGPGAKPIADEILDRMIKKQLDAEQTKQVVNTVLARQGDPAQSWSDEWGDLIERAQLDGQLTEEQLATFYRQAPQFELVIRPTVAAGDLVPLLAKVSSTRIASGTNTSLNVAVKTLKIGDRTLKARSSGSLGSSLLMPISIDPGESGAFIQLTGKKNQFGMMFNTEGSEVRVSRKVPTDLAPGVYPVTVELSLTPFDMSAARMGGKKSKPKAATVTLNGSIRVVAESDSPITMTPADAAMDEKLAKQLRPEQVEYHKTSSTRNSTLPSPVNIAFPFEKVPVNLAHKVTLVTEDGTEHSIGPITTGQGLPEQSMNFSSMFNPDNTTKTISAMNVRNLAGKTCTIKLTPDPAIAKRTINLSSIYGGTILIKDVPITTTRSSSGLFGGSVFPTITTPPSEAEPAEGEEEDKPK